MQRKRKKFKVKNEKVNKYAQIIDDELDLHGFNQVEAKDLVDNFLDHARCNQFFKIRIITGKGKGILNELVKNILRKENLKFQDAKINEGGSGAIDIKIK